MKVEKVGDNAVVEASLVKDLPIGLAVLVSGGLYPHYVGEIFLRTYGGITLLSNPRKTWQEDAHTMLFKPLANGEQVLLTQEEEK